MAKDCASIGLFLVAFDNSQWLSVRALQLILFN